MKTHQFSNRVRQLIKMLLMLILAEVAPFCSQAQNYSSDQLFKMGQDAYRGYNFVDAAVYLYAYMQTKPDLATTNPPHAAEVQKAYEYSVDKVRRAITERDDLRKQLARVSRDDNTGSTTAGLEMPPPPLHAPQDQAGRNRFAATEFVNTVAGVWKYEMVSEAGGGVHRGTLTISLRKSDVSGEMETWDNSARVITGSWVNGVLELRRDTGLETVQYFKIGVKGNSGQGSFKNDGRYPDYGTITISRQ